MEGTSSSELEAIKEELANAEEFILPTQHDLENSKQQIKETVEHVVETTKELAQEAIENIKETVEITKAEIDNAIEKQDAKVKSDIQNLSTPEATTTKSKNTRKKK